LGRRNFLHVFIIFFAKTACKNMQMTHYLADETYRTKKGDFHSFSFREFLLNNKELLASVLFLASLMLLASLLLLESLLLLARLLMSV
jgi:hypothetical protein